MAILIVMLTASATATRSRRPTPPDPTGASDDHRHDLDLYISRRHRHGGRPRHARAGGRLPDRDRAVRAADVAAVPPHATAAGAPDDHELPVPVHLPLH